MSLDRYAKRVTRALQRAGKPTTVYRETSGTANNYGKKDGEWNNPTEVGTWNAFISYSYRSDSPEQVYTGTGERDQETPKIHFPIAADVQDGDRVEQNGRTFEITSEPVEYQTHYEANSIRVEK